MNSSMVEDLYLTNNGAREILNSATCSVQLNISLKEMNTVPGISDRDTIFIQEIGDTHIHNIKSIKDPVNGNYIPIRWGEE